MSLEPKQTDHALGHGVGHAVRVAIAEGGAFVPLEGGLVRPVEDEERLDGVA